MNTSAESGSTYVHVQNNSVCYSASKASVYRISTGLACELRENDIAVNSPVTDYLLKEGVKIRLSDLSGHHRVDPSE